MKSFLIPVEHSASGRTSWSSVKREETKQSKTKQSKAKQLYYKIIGPRCATKSCYINWIPEITSFWLSSDDTRYHWTEHLERGGELSERGLSCRDEPRVSEPSRTYGADLFCSALLLFASYKGKGNHAHNTQTQFSMISVSC
jgi:hypothetical protein